MNIDALTTKQKSVMLAKVMGINFRLYSHSLYFETADDQLFCELFPWGAKQAQSEAEVFERWFPDLYEAHHITMAWRVLNWAAKWINSEDALGNKLKWYYAISDQLRWDLPPAEAQAGWLDKILELAITAGMVQANEITEKPLNQGGK